MFNIAHSPGNSMTRPGIGFSGKAYPMVAMLSDQAIASRDLAKRARRLAGFLTTVDDAARLLRYADDLDAQAADLDRRENEGD
jgi:hypothetical protein